MVMPEMKDQNGNDATYLRESALSASQSTNEQLHVTLRERRHVDLLGVVVRHDDREFVDWMVLGILECFAFGR